MYISHTAGQELQPFINARLVQLYHIVESLMPAYFQFHLVNHNLHGLAQPVNIVPFRATGKKEDGGYKDYDKRNKRDKDKRAVDLRPQVDLEELLQQVPAQARLHHHGNDPEQGQQYQEG